MFKPIEKATSHAKMPLSLKPCAGSLLRSRSIKAPFAVLIVSKLYVHKSAQPPDCSGPAEALFCMNWSLCWPKGCSLSSPKSTASGSQWVFLGRHNQTPPPSCSFHPTGRKSKVVYSVDLYISTLVLIIPFSWQNKWFQKTNLHRRIRMETKNSYLRAWKLISLYIYSEV